MRLLLDTHAFLWFLNGDPRLSKRARHAMEDEASELFLSTASVWEMAIKAGLERLTLPSSVEEYVAEKIAEGFRILPIEWTHAAAVQQLPAHHRDPFDRLLIAQSKEEDMSLVTGDSVFKAYNIRVIW